VRDVTCLLACCTVTGLWAPRWKNWFSFNKTVDFQGYNIGSQMNQLILIISGMILTGKN
jgi:hypothetical protein